MPEPLKLPVFERRVMVQERGGAKAALETRLKTMSADALSMAGTATQIAQAIEQTLAKGSPISVQKQMAFLTGALMRMHKDWGVVENLQQLGYAPRKGSGCP